MSGRQAAAVDGSPLISAVARSKACDYSSPASKTHIVCLFAELGGGMGTHAELRRLLELLASFPTTEATDRRRLQVQFVFRFRFTFPLTVHLSHCLLFVHGLRREKTSKFILCPICLQLWVISSLLHHPNESRLGNSQHAWPLLPARGRSILQSPCRRLSKRCSRLAACRRTIV